MVSDIAAYGIRPTGTPPSRLPSGWCSSHLQSMPMISRNARLHSRVAICFCALAGLDIQACADTREISPADSAAIALSRVATIHLSWGYSSHPKGLGLAVGYPFPLAFDAVDRGGAVVPGVTPTYSSSQPAYYTISETGTVTPLPPGVSAYIYATLQTPTRLLRDSVLALIVIPTGQ